MLLRSVVEQFDSVSSLEGIGEADNLFQGGRLLNDPAPPSHSLFLQKRCKIKILDLQVGLTPPLSLRHAT